jgi:hypothetical protein
MELLQDRNMCKGKWTDFNLIEFIEEYGFNAIDYLYYKRRDSLVAIQLDADVMEMLKENERTKKVSLLVTRQRMAIISPTKSAPNKTKGSLTCACLSIQIKLMHGSHSVFFTCHFL